MASTPACPDCRHQVINHVPACIFCYLIMAASPLCSSLPRSKTRDVNAVAEEARNKLHERGEKLRNLDEKAADLENSAAGFADMAKKMAERERNKKWWQM